MDAPYNLELNSSDARIQDYGNLLRVPLNAYQAAEVKKAVAMERGAIVLQTSKGRHQVHTNIGIFGDPSGSGKTVTSLALVAANRLDFIHNCPHQHVYMPDRRAHGGARLNVLTLDEPSISARHPIMYKTTLIIVPRGPVLCQWAQSIKDFTTLNACIIKGASCIQRLLATSSDLESVFNAFDCILMHPGIIKRCFHQALPGFERILVDEAHVELGSIPVLNYKFLWLISNSHLLIGRAFPSPTCLGHGVAHLLRERDAMDLIVVRSSPAFIAEHMPPSALVQHTYMCRCAHAVASPLQAFLQVDDVVGAVCALGGSSTSTLAALASNRFVAEQFTHECGICMEPLSQPVMLECSHVFCGRCILSWIGRTLVYASIEERDHSHSSCPICRQRVNNNLSVAITEIVASTVEMAPQAHVSQVIFTKEEMLVRLIMRKPEGKWVVFTTSHACMGPVKLALIGAGILYAELEGSGRQMNEALYNFHGRHLQVLLIALTRPVGGIRIDCATDAVLFNAPYAPWNNPFAGLKPRNGAPLVVHHIIDD